MKNKKINLVLLGILLICLGIVSNDLSGILLTSETIHNDNEINLRSAGFWNLTGSPIVIDDSNPSKNWSYTAAHYDWCSGSGTLSDPYLIENVTINGQGLGTCIEIKNSNAYFILKNCTFYNSDNSIFLNNTNNGKMIDNKCTNNTWTGILLMLSSNNTLSGNKANYNGYSGIALQYGNGNNLSRNTVSNNNYPDPGGYHIGIYMVNCNNTIITENIFNNNRDIAIRLDGHNNTLRENLMYNSGIYFDGSFEELNSTIIDTTNLVNEKPVYYYKHQFGLKPIDFLNAGQIYLFNCNDSLISDFTLSNCTVGISLYYSNNITVSDCTLKNNVAYGIKIHHSNYNNILKNQMYDNRYGLSIYIGKNHIISENTIKNILSLGVYVIDSVNNIITSNIIKDCEDTGLYLQNSSNTTVYENYFIKNEDHVYITGGSYNSWNSSTIGNYWDTYDGIDANHDGIGDTPFMFSGGTDYLPIVDNIPPNIVINTPNSNDLFGSTAPNFNIEITELLEDTMWYTLDGDLTNYTFITNGTINQDAWNLKANGSVVIRFYANDTSGNIGFSEILVQKDSIAPIISILNPTMNEEFGQTAPAFSISVEEGNLDKMWYIIAETDDKIFIDNKIGTINQLLWDSLPNGNVIIRFYANDSMENIGFQDVIVLKMISQSNPPEIPGYNILLLLGIVSTIAVIIVKKRLNHLN